MEETTIQHPVFDALIANFGDAVIGIETQYDFAIIEVSPEKCHDIIRFLFDSPDFEYQYLTTLCGLHYPDKKQIGVMYQLHNLPKNTRIRLKAFMSEENPTIKTITDIYPAANWMERQEYDFFGIKFTGHPNLKRILNVDDMVVFPMRKEFPLEDQTRKDKNDTMFGR